MLTVLGTTMGDCGDEDPEHSVCEQSRREHQLIWFGIDFGLLIGLGWLFYRAEMKDDEF